MSSFGLYMRGFVRVQLAMIQAEIEAKRHFKESDAKFSYQVIGFFNYPLRTL